MNEKTAGRTLDLFEAFAALGRPLSLSELARAIGVPVSSCFGLVRTLEGRGYLYALGARRSFFPTKRLLEQARLIAARDPVAERAGTVLAALRDKTGETTILGKRLGSQAVYLDIAESPHSVRYTARVGDFKPLHSSAIGKALLGQLDRAERDALLGPRPLPRVTPATITSRRALEADLAAGRARGWYLTRGENVRDVMAVAAAARIGDEPFAIAVAGPIHRMTLELERHAATVMEARDALEGGA